MLDGPTLAILRQLNDLGYDVCLDAGEASAVHRETMDCHRVVIEGGDEYRAAVFLATIVGVDLQ